MSRTTLTALAISFSLCTIAQLSRAQNSKQLQATTAASTTRRVADFPTPTPSIAATVTNSPNRFIAKAVDVTDQTIRLGGGKKEELLFGFAAGDRIIFNFSELNGKELKEIEIIEYPTLSRFSDYKTSIVKNKEILVAQQGVFVFRLKNSSLSKRICKLKIQRIPASEASVNFNPAVSWITKQDTIWQSYTTDVVIGYDTVYVPRTRRALVKTELEEQLISDDIQRPGRLQGTDNRSTDNRSTDNRSIDNRSIDNRSVDNRSTDNRSTDYKSSVVIQLPINTRMPYRETRVVAWAYWIGTGIDANRAWQQNVRTVRNLNMDYYTPLAAYANGSVNALQLPRTGPVINYYITNQENRDLFMQNQPFRNIADGSGVGAYKKFTGQIQSQGTYYLCVENANPAIPLELMVKVTALIEKAYFEDQQYEEMVVTPILEKQIKQQPYIRNTNLPVTGL